MNFEALLLEGSSEILLLLDADSLQIVAASQASYETLGYGPGALIGMQIGEIECALSDLFFWEELASSPGLMEASSSYRCLDGSIMEVRKFAKRVGDAGQYYQLRARPARRPHKAAEADITGLHLSATLEATDDGIVLTDIDGTILNMNRRFSNMMALPEHLLAERDDHGIVGFIESILQATPGPADAPTALSQAVDLKLDLGGDTFETLYLADGRVLECVSHPARDRDRTIGRVFCYRDITQRVQHEQYLQEARDIAEQATLSKGQFLANMSHEIRTPMNAILGMLKLIHATDLTERQLDYISKAEGAAQSLLGLLNDILDFSKIEAGKLELDPQPFATERILRELSVILATNLGSKPVELLYDIDPDVPPILNGDALRLQQILINLGGNAIKFTSQGEVVVQIRVLAKDAEFTSLRIGVKDTGIGIAPENQSKIFGDFSQAEASTTRRYGGTGLGLSICKRLVELMGGELKVTSALGHGSHFYFEIRLALVAPEEAHDPLNHPGHFGHQNHPTMDLAPEDPQEVLVIDDNANAREILCRMITSIGWTAHQAASGEEAMRLVQAQLQAKAQHFHAVFVDWEMPGMDGWETLAQLRELGNGIRPPIWVMLAADRRQALGQRSLQEQASLNAFLVRPVTAAMLREVVAEARVGRANFRKTERKANQTGRRLNGLRLLVVEDNLVNQQVARELLMSEGALVTLADDGLVALNLLKDAGSDIPFDAVLMDVQMPVMDGFTATRAIRKDLGLDALPIIAMTANAMSSDREDCLDAGMNDHVGKPFDLSYLVKVLLQTTGFKVPAAAPMDGGPPSAQAAVPKPVAAPQQTNLQAVALSVDVTTALNNLEGMTDLYLSLVEQFQTELEGLVAEYHRTLSASLLPETARQMHTLKGTAATLGVSALSELARELEHLCKNSTTPEAALARESELASMVQASAKALATVCQQLQMDTPT